MRVSKACRSPREEEESEIRKRERERSEIARGEMERKVREEGAGWDRVIALTLCVCVYRGENICVCVGRRARVEREVGWDGKEEWGAY